MRKEMYSPLIIDQMRSSVYLPGLVQKYTSLNRQNRGLCPFHADTNPSFSVDARKGLWHCFGCGKGGDAFSFIMEAEHLTFPNAVKLLAFETGIRLPESESINRTLTEKWKERQKKLDQIEEDEKLFRDLENASYDCLRFEAKCLSPQENRTARDYTKELLIEEEFYELDEFVKKREKLFEDMRRRIRYGE